jgi:hypothetical protein
MALTSPGVEVTITDQSQYLPAPGGSVPLVILATAQNKADPTGTGVASATTAANAGKLYQVTSQRDLVSLYGSPFFYTTTNGTPIQGYELNEYGLLAAYSTLGVTNRCYVLRADIDLASLVGQTGRPVGFPDNNTYWLDTTTSTWGIYEFNATTGKFVLQSPIVITNPDDLSANVPLSSIGNIGDYAVNAIQITASPSSQFQYFHKTTTNSWAVLGSTAWKGDHPTVQCTNSNPALTPGQTFVISVDSLYSAQIAVPVATNNNVFGLAAAINNLDWYFLAASVRDGKLCIFSKQYDLANADPAGAKNIVISSDGGTGTLFSDLGVPAADGVTLGGSFYQPDLALGTAAQMPLWTSSQTYPRPTGSVWIKQGQAGNGFAPVVANFNATTNVWVNKNVSIAQSDWSASASIDATGGQAIAAGTVYAQYGYDSEIVISPSYLWERIATGPTVVTGTVSAPVFSSGPYTLYVQTSVPGSTSLSSVYTVTVPDNATATGFVTAWSAANITYTTASVTTDGAIQLTHSEGGEITLDDHVNNVSNGLLTTAGFVNSVTDGCKYGPGVITSFTSVATTALTGVGGGATIDVSTEYAVYQLTGKGVGTLGAGGSGYAIGDTIKVLGSLVGGVDGANDITLVVTELTTLGSAVTAVTFHTPITSAAAAYTVQLSNWRSFNYTANEGAPAVAPANDTNWFYSVVDQVDIMVQKAGAWIGYGKTAYDSTGAPSATGVNATDPNGPIIAATAPTVQSDGSVLAYGDLWLDTSDLEVYPVISRWESVDSVDRWVLLDNSDQVSSTGIVFADARWATAGTVSPTDDPIATIPTLLQSNYLDLDAPTATLYPQGMLLFNTRRSGYNVKQYKSNYFNSTDFPGDTLPAEKAAWVTVSGNQSNGSPYMGRKAQRAMVVQALNAVIATNTDIRDEDNNFNLMATPNYPELQPNMVVLNNDRGDTGYILGDTPLRLPANATAIQAWANNTAGATATGEDGCVTRDTYLGLFYPSGITTDLSGNLVAVPSSHMMLRTFIRNDNIAYPWLAAAGTRRGTIDNATNIGYLNGQTGEFQTTKTNLGIRDVLYTNSINPMVFFTGVGLLNYGNKTSFASSSALDRTNVARLVAYIRRQLTLAARPFVFEPNDALTRQQIAGVVQTLMVDLVAKRGLYDYLVVCDDSNNTPARIDRNELWIDVAIEPVKSAEFIYIPVRILNTGELSGK